MPILRNFLLEQIKVMFVCLQSSGNLAHARWEPATPGIQVISFEKGIPSAISNSCSSC
jgi:hypothetical protein